MKDLNSGGINLYFIKNIIHFSQQYKNTLEGPIFLNMLAFALIQNAAVYSLAVNALNNGKARNKVEPSRC